MANSHDRVKFYSASDGSLGWYLPIAEEKLKNTDLTQPILDVNTALELFNVCKMINLDRGLKTWSVEYHQQLKALASLATANISRFFKTITETTFIDTFKSVDHQYYDDFWELFNYYKLQNRIEGIIIKEIIDQNLFVIHMLLKHKDIVHKYSALLADQIMSSAKNAEILIHAFLYKSDNDANLIFLPIELTASRREELVNKYISDSEVNPNYLRMLYESRDNENLRLEPKTKHAAKQRYNSFVRNHFSKNPNSGFPLSYSILFDPDFDEPIKTYKYSKGETLIVYGKKWVDDNLDYPTLWNNCIYMLNFVDFQCRCNFLSNPATVSVTQRVFGIHGKSTYPRTNIDEFQNAIFNHVLEAYQQVLQLHGISVEKMIDWFFSIYLKHEFSIDSFTFNAPSENTSVLEKCKLLATELDSVLKQFDMFSRQGYIDRALFEFSSDSMKIEDIPSLLNRKYFYASGIDTFSCMNCLFSDQTSLTYTKNSKKEYKTLFELLRKGKVKREDFHEYNLPSIDFLINSKCIRVDVNSTLHVIGSKVSILRDLYYKQFCFSLYYDALSDVLSEMEHNGEIRFASTLFSEQEQDYLIFVLKQSKFSNGLDLRNKYVHGTYPKEVEEQREDYFEFLKTFMFVIIKINQELCYRVGCCGQES